MHTVIDFTPKADFSEYNEWNEEYMDTGALEKREYKEDYERELLLAMGDTDDELYMLANEIDETNRNYVKMKSNSLVQDYDFAA